MVARVPFRAVFGVPLLPAAALLAALVQAGCSPTGSASEASAALQDTYFPPRGAWEHRAPEEVGLDPAGVADAVAYAVANESSAPRDLLEDHVTGSFGREPMPEANGPFKERGPATGLIIRHGYIVAEWGEPQRVDPTFSVSKSFLSTTVGLAYDRGFIRDVNDRVRDYFTPVIAVKGPPSGGAGEAAPRGMAYGSFEMLTPFESEHAGRITWDHMLRQTSDWEGTLWGKPDWVDRPQGDDIEAWRTRERYEPGEHWMYNDVRVNLLALAALNVWRRPLPQVLKEYVMDPIGASESWRWYGYDDSWVIMDGELVQSVAGGAHWGGGMWISAEDQARFGLFTLHRGRWGDQQLLSDEWVTMALTPTPVREGYGFMNWYLLGEPEVCSVACGESAFYHNGSGPNIVYVDPANDIIIVSRWVPRWREIVSRVLGAIEDAETPAAAETTTTG